MLSMLPVSLARSYQRILLILKVRNRSGTPTTNCPAMQNAWHLRLLTNVIAFGVAWFVCWLPISRLPHPRFLDSILASSQLRDSDRCTQLRRDDDERRRRQRRRRRHTTNDERRRQTTTTMKHSCASDRRLNCHVYDLTYQCLTAMFST